LKPQVLICGAGPTGLTAALWLTRLGIHVRIIDRTSGPGETSRALAVQARTLEFHRMSGTVEDVLAAGVRVNTLNILTPSGGTAPLDLSSFGSGITRFAHAFVLPQDIHERILIEHLAKLGVGIERQTELQSFHDAGSNVTAVLRSGDRTEAVEVDYLIGADGAHSLVRHGLGIGFPGGAYDQSFYVADVEGAHETTDNSMNLVLGGYGFAIVLPVRQSGTLRIIGVVPKKYETLPEINFDTIRADIERDSRVHVSKVNWFSTYRVHHRVAESFSKGRVFIAGDAGHIHSPAGGQGMNTGMGDAVNLAWKLAAVLQDRAAPHILDSYHIERHTFAEALIDGTDKAFRLVTSQSMLAGIFRRNVLVYVVRRLLRNMKFRRRFFEMNAQTRIAYPSSPLSTGPKGKGVVKAGDRLPYVELASGDNYACLNALDWQVHVYGHLTTGLGSAVRAQGIALHVFPWNADARRAGITDGMAFLIRPDGHIGLVAPTQSETAFTDYIRRHALRPRVACADQPIVLAGE
jgi:2-polyprenyl-6-methoxyphenol hydroxylase-like FAD-dependent oxidoreductase